MNDYISREAVVRYLKEYSEKECNSNSPYGMITSSVLNKAERTLSEMPATDVQPVKWISVKDRLPEIGMSVLIYYQYWYGDKIQVAKLKDDGMMFDVCGAFNIRVEAVTHWMPLPESPKGGDTE